MDGNLEIIQEKFTSIHQNLEVLSKKVGDVTLLRDLSGQIESLQKFAQTVLEMPQDTMLLKSALATLRKENNQLRQSDKFSQMENLQQEMESLKQKNQRLSEQILSLQQNKQALQAEIDTLKAQRTNTADGRKPEETGAKSGIIALPPKDRTARREISGYSEILSTTVVPLKDGVKDPKGDFKVMPAPTEPVWVHKGDAMKLLQLEGEQLDEIVKQGLVTIVTKEGKTLFSKDDIEKIRAKAMESDTHTVGDKNTKNIARLKQLYKDQMKDGASS